MQISTSDDPTCLTTPTLMLVQSRLSMILLSFLHIQVINFHNIIRIIMVIIINNIIRIIMIEEDSSITTPTGSLTSTSPGSPPASEQRSWRRSSWARQPGEARQRSQWQLCRLRVIMWRLWSARQRLLGWLIILNWRLTGCKLLPGKLLNLTLPIEDHWQCHKHVNKIKIRIIYWSNFDFSTSILFNT